jgi:hypothetical protein
MTKASTLRRASIYYEILAYLTEHPHAQDTVEGIVTWWLLEQRIKRLTPQVTAALQQMVEENYVIPRTDRTGRVSYQINKKKLREIRRLIAEESSFH